MRLRVLYRDLLQWLWTRGSVNLVKVPEKRCLDVIATLQTEGNFVQFRYEIKRLNVAFYHFWTTRVNALRQFVYYGKKEHVCVGT